MAALSQHTLGIRSCNTSPDRRVRAAEASAHQHKLRGFRRMTERHHVVIREAQKGTPASVIASKVGCRGDYLRVIVQRLRCMGYEVQLTRTPSKLSPIASKEADLQELGTTPIDWSQHPRFEDADVSAEPGMNERLLFSFAGGFRRELAR